MFSPPAKQRYELLCAVTVNAAVSSDSQVHTCVPLLKAAHYAQTDNTFIAEVQRAPCLFFSEHTRHRLCFPLDGQWCECFTSKRLSWDENGLGLPLETPLAVTFSSCERIIRSRTRTSRKLLWVILPPLDLCIISAFRMVMSVRWKNNFLVHFQVLRAIL